MAWHGIASDSTSVCCLRRRCCLQRLHQTTARRSPRQPDQLGPRRSPHGRLPRTRAISTAPPRPGWDERRSRAGGDECDVGRCAPRLGRRDKAIDGRSGAKAGGAVQLSLSRGWGGVEVVEIMGGRCGWALGLAAGLCSGGGGGGGSEPSPSTCFAVDTLSPLWRHLLSTIFSIAFPPPDPTCLPNSRLT